MSKSIGIPLIILGVIIIVASVAADSFGLGISVGFGWKQILGTAVGVLAVIIGGLLVIRQPDKTSNPETKNK
jgi:hypothetical protein